MRTIITMVLLSTLLSMNAQTFVKVNGKATDVAISPKDGSVYVVGTSKNVFKYDARGKRFKPHAAQTKNIKRIAISRSNQVYAISTRDKVMRSVGSSSWKWLSAFGTDVASDNTGYVWAPHKDKGGDIQRYVTSWKRPLSRVIIDVDKVAPINDRVAWALMKDKSIQKYENARWKSMPGAALDIAVDFATTDAYVIGTSKRIFKWSKTKKKWLPLPGTRTDFVSLDVHRGKIWATSTDKSIYRYDLNGNTSAANSNSDNNTQDYSGTYRVTFTKIRTFSPEQSSINKGIDIYGTMGVYLNAKTNSGSVKINPLGNKKNRVWDVSKSNSRYFPSRYYNQEKKVLAQVVDGESRYYKYFGEENIDIIREFKVAGEAANNDLVFDIQCNLSQKLLVGTLDFKWQRLKVPFNEIEFGKEKYFTFRAGSYPGTHIFIGYKIEKQ